MRRRAPRPVGAALAELTRSATPATLLARVQACWPEVVGASIAGEAEPASERAGTITLTCRSAVWAQELTLLAPDLVDRLNAALAGSPPGPIAGLRFRVGKGA